MCNLLHATRCDFCTVIPGFPTWWQACSFAQKLQRVAWNNCTWNHALTIGSHIYDPSSRASYRPITLPLHHAEHPDHIPASTTISTYVIYSMVCYITPVQTVSNFITNCRIETVIVSMECSGVRQQYSVSRASARVVLQSIRQAKRFWKRLRRTVACRKSDSRYRSSQNE